MWEVIFAVVIAAPVGIITFIGCCCLGFVLVYKLVRNSLISLVIFFSITVAIISFPMFAPFNWEITYC